MIISINWLKQFVDIDTKIDDLKTLIGARLVEVESVDYIGDKYKDVLIVRVISCEKIEGSDHLHLTKIDDGGKCQLVERDENGFIQVVCGAPNIAAGQLVAWLPPESIVPETYGDSEPFKLGIRNLRGKVSNGMIASGRELSISDDHEGILVINDEVAAGTSFAEHFELDDYLLNIENKSLTHRPDCFGIVGFAREIAAISGKQFKTPDWLLQVANDIGLKDAEADVKVIIDNPELCSRYLAIVMSNADGKIKSPIKIQTYLSRSGVRPINAVVDVTNYLMLLTGQPLHAFDYDKVVGLNNGSAEIHVRAGLDKEKLELLDGRTIELAAGDIVIASGNTAIGLAGAMGGASTEIDDNTTKIIIESASFNLYNLRSTQMRHGIFSEAITRFTKGQSPELSAPVVAMVAKLMNQWAGAEVLSNIVDVYPRKKEQKTVQISRETIENILGLSLETSQIVNILQNAEFKVEVLPSDVLSVVAPYWRADIGIAEDLIEEVGRINGFDNIKPVLPTRSFSALRPAEFDDFRKQLRKILTRAGANEVLTYSFIHGDTLRKAGQDPQNSYRIVNSISPDLQYYRQTLTPSLLNLIHSNIKQGYDDFALYEFNKIHQRQDGLNEEGVPIERNSIALALANNKREGNAYYQAKYILTYLFKTLGYAVKYEKIDASDDPMFAPFEYRHSAKITDIKTNALIGVVGEYKKSVFKGFKLPSYAAGFELNADSLFANTRNLGSGYTPVNRYPITERDICFRVASDTDYGQIVNILDDELKDIDLDSEVLPVDIYQPKDLGVKNITVRVKLAASDHTLTSDEVNSATIRLTESVIAKTGATVI